VPPNLQRSVGAMFEGNNRVLCYKCVHKVFMCVQFVLLCLEGRRSYIGVHIDSRGEGGLDVSGRVVHNRNDVERGRVAKSDQKSLKTRGETAAPPAFLRPLNKKR